MKEEDTPDGFIMVVDDNPADVDLLCKMLNDCDYRVRAFTDSRFALQSALANPPDLLLLDIKMPDLGGLAFCRQLKENPETADVSVIFISALGETEDKVKAFDAGGMDYVTKPFEQKEVLARVRVHCDLRMTNKSLKQEVSERRKSEEKLRQVTLELQASNTAMIDREDRIIELKEEVNRLAEELGREPPYPPIWGDNEA